MPRKKGRPSIVLSLTITSTSHSAKRFGALAGIGPRPPIHFSGAIDRARLFAFRNYEHRLRRTCPKPCASVNGRNRRKPVAPTRVGEGPVSTPSGLPARVPSVRFCGLALRAGYHHVDFAAGAFGADQPLMPIRDRHLGAVPLRLFGRIGFYLVAAIATPNDQADAGRR